MSEEASPSVSSVAALDDLREQGLHVRVGGVDAGVDVEQDLELLAVGGESHHWSLTATFTSVAPGDIFSVAPGDISASRSAVGQPLILSFSMSPRETVSCFDSSWMYLSISSRWTFFT